MHTSAEIPQRESWRVEMGIPLASLKTEYEHHMIRGNAMSTHEHDEPQEPISTVMRRVSKFILRPKHSVPCYFVWYGEPRFAISVTAEGKYS